MEDDTLGPLSPHRPVWRMASRWHGPPTTITGGEVAHATW